MKRQIKNALIIAIVGIININGVCDPPAPLPTCSWDDQGAIMFSDVKLYPPTSPTLWGFDPDFPIDAFFKIFWRPKSTIDIVTSVSGCTGTMSQSKLFTEASQIGVGLGGFENLKSVNNVAQSVHNVKITMISGPYTSMTNANETGTVVWTKVIDTNPYDRLQPALSSVGVFKSDRANVIKVYVKDSFKELEMY